MKQNILFKVFTLVLILGVFIILYSHFIGTKGLYIREYPVRNNKIPNGFDGLKIVHFTDLHYGSTIRKNELNNLVNEINRLKPDIVVFTGDLIEEGIYINEKDTEILTDALNKINASIDKYYVNGNHDIHKNYQKIMDNTNFKDLNNKNELIYYKENTPIRIVGLNDYLKFDLKIDEAFNYESDDLYTILIAHDPDVYDKLDNHIVDLMLSGHSHNGQVRIPFLGAVYTPVGSKKYYDEKYELNNTLMFISGGIGTSKYPFRLLVKPSFNFYRLYTK